MDTMASQMTSLTIVYSTVYSGADQRKHKWSVTRNMFPFDDVIMIRLVQNQVYNALRIAFKDLSVRIENLQ